MNKLEEIISLLDKEEFTHIEGAITLYVGIEEAIEISDYLRSIRTDMSAQCIADSDIPKEERLPEGTIIRFTKKGVQVTIINK